MTFDLRDRARIEHAFWQFRKLSEVIFKMDQIRQWMVEVQSALSSELKSGGIPIIGNVPIEEQLPLSLRTHVPKRPPPAPIKKRASRKKQPKRKGKKRK